MSKANSGVLDSSKNKQKSLSASIYSREGSSQGSDFCLLFGIESTMNGFRDLLTFRKIKIYEANKADDQTD